LELSLAFKNDVRERLLTGADYHRAAAAKQLMNVLFADTQSAPAYYEGSVTVGSLAGGGEGSGASLNFFDWGEGYVGVDPMRVWYVLDHGREVVLGLHAAAQDGPPYPEEPTAVERAREVLMNGSLYLIRD
jgi:hypothetical protein